MTTADGESPRAALANGGETPSSKAGTPPTHPAEHPIPAKTKKQNIRVSPAVVDAASKSGEQVLVDLRTSPGGLAEADAEERARTAGPNEIAQERKQGWLLRLLKTTRNPLVILLTALSIVSFLTGDARGGTVMAIMVALSVVLRFWQEARADAAAEKLKAMIHVTATVVRDGEAREVPLRDLVPGDIVRLAAGDMIPGDVRLLLSKDLFVSQGSLTGESLPVEKFHDPETNEEASPTELKNICFMGTSVESGTATAVVVTTGVQTYFGSMARSITGERVQTSFDQGLNRFTWLMMELMAVMVPLVFLINGFTKHDWKGAFFFALAVAVGLAPEMLPMIVSVCLSNGALVRRVR
jgi:P-type Mg2+ transporter